MNYQRFLWTLLLLTLLPATLIAWPAVPARASILRVPQDYPTIQDAVNAASAGDTIQVSNGTYLENVIVSTRVTIVGDNASTTTVDGGSNDVVFNIQANNVELHNLTIRNGGLRYSGVTIFYPYDGLVIRNTRITDNVVGVVISEADGNTIEDNVFINNQMYGIDVKYSTNNIIRNNQVSKSAYGIEISDTTNSQVVNNTVSDTSYGIYAPYSNNNNVSANMLFGNSWNIYLTHSNSNIIENNEISGGSVGIQIMRSQSNSVFNNTVSNSSYGIYLGYCGANTVNGNTASLNDWGIELYNSTGSTIKDNIVLDNTWGMYIAEESDGNNIYHNNFFYNVKQAYQDLTSSNTWNTSTSPYQGNYWSDYKGADDGSGGRPAGDGIGDTYLPWAGVDWYPLMSPLGLLHDVAVTSVTPSTSQVYVGRIVNVTVVANNEGNFTETFNITAKYDNLPIETQQVTSLPSGSQTTLIFSWNTTGLQPGANYTISAVASTVPGEIDTQDNLYTDGNVKIKMIGDVNGDDIIDIEDLATVAYAYGSQPGDANWNPEADLNQDNKVDIDDLIIVARNYGQSV